MNANNIILLSDSYKYSHPRMYLDNTTGIYSYFESRKGSKFPYVIFYGLQYVLKKHLEGVVVTKEKIDEAEALFNQHLGEGVFDRAGWDYILEAHGGKLPVRIRAVREGSLIPTDNVLMTVESTDEKCPWITNFIETLLTQIWYPTTVATLSHNIRRVMKKWIDETCDCSEEDKDAILQYCLHDFGCRGVESMEAAAIGGSAHLLNFAGTDTVPALTIPSNFYGESDSYVPGVSIRATEHSVMTARGEAGEFDVVESLLAKNPDGFLATVIDSYDYRRYIEVLGTKYKEQILNRNGRIVFRPDSGEPVSTSLDVIELLGKYFGYTVNGKGYKVLPNQVRCLWGDGITEEGIDAILKNSAEHGWSAENWVFGCGGGLLQKINRDTCRFAFKCSSQKYDGEWHDVWKKPIDMSKASKRGRLALVWEDGPNLTRDGGRYQTIREEELLNNFENLLELVFENGELKREQKFSDIREIVSENR